MYTYNLCVLHTHNCKPTFVPSSTPYSFSDTVSEKLFSLNSLQAEGLPLSCGLHNLLYMLGTALPTKLSGSLPQPASSL